MIFPSKDRVSFLQKVVWADKGSPLAWSTTEGAEKIAKNYVSYADCGYSDIRVHTSEEGQSMREALKDKVKVVL